MNIYVGNISYNSSEEDLGNLFSEYGVVNSVKIVINKHTGRSKGFGFVEMASDEEGSKAVESLDGYDLNGRNLRVDKANDREEKTSTPSE
ncbi:MAG TPA: RNA-binding protein [Flavobacteriales bacterium]|nr:RNA-binding protein [Flavobacteriales bacterium]